MHEYERKLLSVLSGAASGNIESIAKATSMERDQIMWAAESLAALGAVNVSKSRTEEATLTEEGRRYLGEFPEERVIKEMGGKSAILDKLDNIGLLWAKKNGWIAINDKSAHATEEGKRAASGKEYMPRTVLNLLDKKGDAAGSDPDIIETLVKRKLVRIKEHTIITRIEITAAGRKMLANDGSGGGEIGQLTREIITGGGWRNSGFRKYDVSSPAEARYPSRMHPMREFTNKMRQVWFNMGFTETLGPMIEPAFWSFDALFSPQDHPTREMQDTFFLSNPETIDVEDMALFRRVKAMHVKGGGREWREEVAKQALLRVHTTSVSARSIYKHAKEDEGNFPMKLFSIGRTFRNESIDYKHLAEFHQSDGIVIGNRLGISNLLYILKSFYREMGLDVEGKGKLKIKPSYFPFVEPGLEVNYFDENRGEWIELCGGGIIRKEITKALGTNKTVLAWGMSVERLMFDTLGIETLMELYRNEVGWLRKRKPIER